VGADALVGRATLSDPFRGKYIDQADIFEVMRSAITEEHDP
jgi:hypothetical protein